MPASELVIRNEEEAWDLLRRACEDQLPDLGFRLKFESWPRLIIRFEGDQYNSSMTTKVMESFIDLQQLINRTYAKIYYNQANSRVLTDDEKNKIELAVQVSPGSAKFDIDLQKIFEKFVEGVSTKMESKHVVILAIAGGLMWTGNTAYKNYLQNQKDIKGIEMQKFAGDEETKRMKIFADAMKQESHVIAIKADSEEMYNKILKAGAGAKKIHIPGASLDGADAKKLIAPKRTASTEVRLDGIYRVLDIDNSKLGQFDVKVTNGTDLTFTAKLDQTTIITKEQNKELLSKALWSRESVSLMIQGKKLRDGITQATILDVMDKYKK